MRCPVCGSRNVKRLKTGSYKCEDCGFVFYEERDAIIDMRDLLDADSFSEEEISAVGEHMKAASQDLSRRIYGDEVRSVFRGNIQLDEMAEKYGEENLYGVFIDFEGKISGTILIVMSEENVKKITSGEEHGIIHALRFLAREAFKEFVDRLSWDAEIKRIDVAYDSVSALIDYLNSEMKNRNAFIMNYELLSDGNWHGDIIIMPSKDSLEILREFVAR